MPLSRAEAFVVERSRITTKVWTYDDRNLLHGAASFVFVVLLLCAASRPGHKPTSKHVQPHRAISCPSGESEHSQPVYIFPDKKRQSWLNSIGARIIGRIEEERTALGRNRPGTSSFDMKSSVADTSDPHHYVGLEGEPKKGPSSRSTQTCSVRTSSTLNASRPQHSRS